MVTVDGYRSDTGAGARARCVSRHARRGPPLASAACSIGALRALRGTLAPEGAIVKVGREAHRFQGPARVFECEEDCFAAVLRRDYRTGDVLVIRNEGPRGGPGMREMLQTTAALYGQGVGETVALVSDGRFSGATRGPVRGPRRSGGCTGWTDRLVRDGDLVTIDTACSTLDLEVATDELSRRRATYEIRPSTYGSGALWKYAQTVGPARYGALTFPAAGCEARL